MPSLTIFRGNDNTIEFDPAGLLTDALTGDVIAGATVAVTLETTAGVEIAGETWPLSMPAVSSEPGNYRAILVDTLSLAAVQEAVAILTADNGADARGAWRLRCPVTDRYE